jgi:FkbM family methyltransferase
MVRFPAKANVLRFLREIGVPIGTVLDVGAHAETVELRLAFPDKLHVLFEPAADFHEAIRRNYAGLDYVLAPLALSDADGSGFLRKNAIDGGAVSHATLIDGADGGPAELVVTARLDTFMANRDDERPYLLKVDVDGYELPILRGAERVLDDVSVLIVEAPLDQLVERLNFVVARGFRLFDIVDQCYYYDMFSQVDLVFVAERYFENPAMRPWQTRPFSWDGWVPIASFEPVVQDATAAARAVAAGGESAPARQ